MRYKIGDTVCIRDDLEMDNKYSMDDSRFGTTVNEMMVGFRGHEAMITNVVTISDRNYYKIDIDEDEWYWTDGMFNDVYDYDLPEPEELDMMYDWFVN